jgi:hypothetical protein
LRHPSNFSLLIKLFNLGIYLGTQKALICGRLVRRNDLVMQLMLTILGCILGEVLLGKPLFPGTSTFNQLERILQHIPTPTQSDIASIASHYGPSVLERAASG